MGILPVFFVLKLTSAATDLIARMGYDPQYGARPVKRLIQKKLLNEISRKILAGEIAEGVSVTIDASEDGFIFQ